MSDSLAFYVTTLNSKLKFPFSFRKQSTTPKITYCECIQNLICILENIYFKIMSRIFPTEEDFKQCEEQIISLFIYMCIFTVY